LSDDLPANLRPIVDFFGLVGSAPVVKDFHVVRAIRVMATLDAAPFDLVFGGGTALARAHRLVRRMSEDVDFKIVPRAAAPISRSALHRALKTLREQVTDALHAAGFAFDPKDEAYRKSRNEDRYTIWNLPYDSSGEAGQGLRPTIQIEMTYAPMRQPPVRRHVSSFVTEAMNRPPDVADIACVSLNETAAEKLVALTRRTAMDAAGLTRGPADPTLVRHIYDLHMMREHVDMATVAALAAEIATTDATEFRNQYPAYLADIAGETRKALDALQNDAAHRRRYDDFVTAMVYGERPSFSEALAVTLIVAESVVRKVQARASYSIKNEKGSV
jgi:predicted nucleotidyltransferase component of viral defense system